LRIKGISHAYYIPDRGFERNTPETKKKLKGSKNILGQITSSNFGINQDLQGTHFYVSWERKTNESTNELIQSILSKVYGLHFNR